MTVKQKILKQVYPLFMLWKKTRGKQKLIQNNMNEKPKLPFHSLAATLNNGAILSFEKLKGRKVLIVNTASLCGYTAQYEELQKLYQHSREDLEIIAFPSNDFKNQEQGSDEEIAAF